MHHRLLPPPADLAPWLSAVMLVSLEAPDDTPRLNRFPALVGGTLTVLLSGRLLLPGAPRAAVLHDAAPATTVLPGAFFTGPSSAPLVSLRQGRLSCIGLAVRPAAIAGLLGEGAAAARDRVVPAAALWGGAWAACEDAVRSAPDHTARLRHLFDFVRRRVSASCAAARRERHDRLALAARGALDAGARSLGLGQRQFERVFAANLGLRPKLFQRIARVEAVLRDALAGVDRGAGLALRHGYFDQAHLARDLRQLAGAPLGHLLVEARRADSEHWPLQVGTRRVPPAARA